MQDLVDTPVPFRKCCEIPQRFYETKNCSKISRKLSLRVLQYYACFCPTTIINLCCRLKWQLNAHESIQSLFKTFNCFENFWLLLRGLSMIFKYLPHLCRINTHAPKLCIKHFNYTIQQWRILKFFFVLFAKFVHFSAEPQVNSSELWKNIAT